MTKTTGKVNDYRDWGIQLGRRFRALKLWFVIRSFGVEGLKDKIRFHLELAKKLESYILSSPEFELMAPRTLNLVCFRYRPSNITDPDKLNKINENLLNKLNAIRANVSDPYQTKWQIYAEDGYWANQR